MSRFLSSTLNYFIVKCNFVPSQKPRFYSLLSARIQCGAVPKNGWRIYQQSRGVHTSRPGVFQSRKSARLTFGLLGVGVGSAFAFWIKDRVSVGKRSECERNKPEELSRSRSYGRAMEVSRDLLRRIKDEAGAPGIVVGVSVDGVPVWSEGWYGEGETILSSNMMAVSYSMMVFSVCSGVESVCPEGLGYADLENRVPCKTETVMRIASISKSLTTTAAAHLWEQDLLDLDAPVQKYVPEFPEKVFEGEAVTITTRMLISHLSGIRHYEKDAKKVREAKEKAKQRLRPPGKLNKEDKSLNNIKKKEDESRRRKKELEQEEYYLKQSFDSVVHAIDLFKDDPLIFKPGTTFLYSTHAFTLLSAVMERAAGQRFLDHMMQMFCDLGMLNTVPEENDPIIYHRSRFYHFSKKGRVVNCPYVDNSYKWAGGGFLSTVGDLLLFGNAMLYSYQMAHRKDKENLLPGFLKPQTAITVWTPVDKTEGSWDKDCRYGMGWVVVEEEQQHGQCRKRRHYVSHTGAAVGASSVLLVMPGESSGEPTPPKGVVVAVMTNMQSVGLQSTALKIAEEFDKARRD